MKNWEELYTEYQPKLQTVASRFARKYHCDHLLEDLVASCTIVFHKRMPRYDESKGTVWTYLRPYFLSAMQKTVRTSCYAMKIPHTRLQNIRMAHAIAAKHLDLPPKDRVEVVAEEMALPVREVTKFFARPLIHKSLNESVAVTFSDDRGKVKKEWYTLQELTYSHFADPEQVYLHSLKLRTLRQAFRMLLEEEQEFVGGYFGVYGHKKRNLAEIGEEYMLTEDGARKKLNSALQKLRNAVQTIRYDLSLGRALKQALLDDLDSRQDCGPWRTDLEGWQYDEICW